ncbi:VCBS repeat-containing protein [bacterium]|nr:VCBS repeat-containing protein [bacterium]
MSTLERVSIPVTKPPQARAASWEVPRLTDPRIPFAGLLTLYCILGFLLFGFNRSPFQMLAILGSGALLDMALARSIHGRKIVPLSAYITCCSLALLLNYSHSSWVLFVPVYLAIGSKYVFTFDGRHVMNPSMFGVAVSLLASDELITAAPAYQWAGGAFALSAFIAMGALVLFVFRIGRSCLVLSFLAFYALQTALRAYVLRFHLPPEVLFLGTLGAPSFFIFTFYMITDPATSPSSARGQVLFALVLTLVDLVLHLKESVYTFFYAALACGVAKLVFLHLRAIFREGPRAYARERLSAKLAKRLAIVPGPGLALGLSCLTVLSSRIAPVDPGFRLVAIPESQSGIHTEMGTLLEEVDPRIQHIAKWVLSVGDAVAVADVDNDGLVDIFLTNPLKRPEDRCALYRNLGGFRFERVPLPDLTRWFADPKAHGLPAAATFVDFDGDGAVDLVIPVGFGKMRLLRNRLLQDGKLSFEDVTERSGVDEHTVSLAATFFDFDRDGKLDLFVANALQTHLRDYPEPRPPLNVFELPKPEFEGDRRMFHFMHNGWHNADNGGPNLLFRGRGDGTFEKLDAASMGIKETHWSLSVATGDLNHDGWTDLYVANDFGPDDLYLNDQGKRFVRIAGKLFGEIGRDTYKGMNATIADFDRNGWLDVYVSDNHHSLQSEGSLLWMTFPSGDPFRPDFRDEATPRGALNERRWGWGAAAGDLDDDGWPEIVQANGMVDDRLDPRGHERKDYLYVNHKLMQTGPEIHTYADKWGDIRGRVLYPNEKRRVYWNRGRGYFVDVADIVGGADPDNSRGVSLVDLDNDGRLDVIVTNQHGPVSIYRNTGVPGRSWIGLSLVGDGKTTSRAAVGTQVVVKYEEDGKPQEQLQEVQVLGGFSGQNDPRLHFGLGAHEGPVEVTIRWYGGREERVTLEANRYHVIRQGKS